MNRYRDHGIELAVFDGSIPLTDTTRLAKDGRDEEIEEFCTLLRTLGELGVTDMAATIRAYRDVGFDGPIRPDHVPTIAGEDNSVPDTTARASSGPSAP